MKVTFLPVPTVILNFVEFVVEMGCLEIIDCDQMTPVIKVKVELLTLDLHKFNCGLPIKSVSDIEINVVVAHVGAECHIGIK